jgi:epoxyqueuosine reductase
MRNLDKRFLKTDLLYTGESFRQAIREQAQRLGFSLVGITTPEPPQHLDVYEAWLQAGRHGEMAYLASERARQRRAAPRLILPECRSILVLGTPYFPATTVFDKFEDTAFARAIPGRVASYAWGDDYHEVLRERLEALAGFIQQLCSERDPAAAPLLWRGYTDTGPVLERELAQRAGLGWIGKNTCLIAPRQGSYFFLAELLLSIELPPDEPFSSDHCGACQRCLEACPTRCILPDRTLDARRCISYLTIELKVEIAPELRPLLGEWVFGCDICQQVCPWNQRFAARQGDPAFAPRPGFPMPDLLAEISLSAEEFNRKFKASPLRRAKRRGYLRNVAVALGNTGAPAALPALQAACNDPEALIAQHAAWAIEQIKAAKRG